MLWEIYFIGLIFTFLIIYFRTQWPPKCSKIEPVWVSFLYAVFWPFTWIIAIIMGTCFGD